MKVIVTTEEKIRELLEACDFNDSQALDDWKKRTKKVSKKWVLRFVRDSLDGLANAIIEEDLK
jgi:hypothetical protein